MERLVVHQNLLFLRLNWLNFDSHKDGQQAKQGQNLQLLRRDQLPIEEFLQALLNVAHPMASVEWAVDPSLMKPPFHRETQFKPFQQASTSAQSRMNPSNPRSVSGCFKVDGRSLPALLQCEHRVACIAIHGLGDESMRRELSLRYHIWTMFP